MDKREGCHCSSRSEMIIPFLRCCCRATCQCCATANAEGEILSKDSVKGLVSGTNIIFQGGFEFEFFHIFSERARCADGAWDVGGRGIHCLIMDKKMSASMVHRAGPNQWVLSSASTVDQAGPDQWVHSIEQAPIDGFYFF